MACWSDYYKKPSCVYRLYDGTGTLLYVGMTTNPLDRIPWHRRHQHWGQQVDHHAEEWFPDRNAAKAGERSAIHHENPIHNLVRPRMECC